MLLFAVGYAGGILVACLLAPFFDWLDRRWGR